MLVNIGVFGTEDTITNAGHKLVTKRPFSKTFFHKVGCFSEYKRFVHLMLTPSTQKCFKLRSAAKGCQIDPRSDHQAKMEENHERAARDGNAHDRGCGTGFGGYG